MRVKRAALAGAAPCLLLAHMMSLSTGDLRVDGNRVLYELRMPIYEVTHLGRPQQDLLENIRFRSGGVEGRMVEGRCQARPDENAYACSAVYEFPGPVEALEADCTFTRVTVPNHVHVLRAASGDKTDQAVFDLSLTRAELRFQPPATLEILVKQTAGGVARALGGMAQIVFLVALALAARAGKEVAALCAMFQAGKLLAVAVVPMTGWQPAPRFVEAAAALTIAYLAVEMLLLPEAGKRWAVVGVLGLFHGLWFLLYLRETGYSAALVMSGAAAVETLVVVACWASWRRLAELARSLRPVRVAASLLLATGLAWFVMRLRG